MSVVILLIANEESANVRNPTATRYRPWTLLTNRPAKGMATMAPNPRGTIARPLCSAV